jgi:glycogen synthase
MSKRRPHIVLATHEVWPFVGGGGIGRYSRDAATLLSEEFDVTILTSTTVRPSYEALRAERDPRLPSPDVRFRWIEEPGEDLSPLWSPQHALSLNCWRALRDLREEHPPDLVEFEDYLGLGAVALDARRAGDDALGDAHTFVRLHTSWEMTSVLDRVPRHHLAARSVMAMERVALSGSAELVAPATDAVTAYRRYYGSDVLAPTSVIAPAMRPAAAPPEAARLPAADPLRLLYVGRLQALKGVDALAHAFMALEDDSITLTLMGGDTDTAPGGGSMRAYLERISEADERVSLRSAAAPDAVERAMREHHVVVVPSRFESFGFVAREALAQNRPVLVTPVGGLLGCVHPGRSGWVARDSTPAALAEALREVTRRRGEIEAMVADGGPRAALEEQIDPDAFVAAYLSRAADRPPRRRADRTAARNVPVSAVVTVCAGDGPLVDTVASLEAQRWPSLEILVATDAVERVPPRLGERLHALVVVEPGSGVVSAARRAALACRRLAGLVVLLRAGDVLEPTFLARCVAALESGAAAYVTPFARGRHPSCAPIGNLVAGLVAEYDVAASVALIRPDSLRPGLPDTAPATDSEDSALFGELARRGELGAVLPEILVRRLRRRRGATERGVTDALSAMGPPRELWEASPASPA